MYQTNYLALHPAVSGYCRLKLLPALQQTGSRPGCLKQGKTGMALLAFMAPLGVTPPREARILGEPPPIVREKAMARHEGAAEPAVSWPPPTYHKLKSLAPTTKHNQTVLVLGGMMNQRDLDLAGNMTEKAGANLVIYNSDAGDAGDCSAGTTPGAWCGQSCDALRLPKHALCTDVPNMGRSEAAFFQYVFDHYNVLEGKQVIFSGSTVGAEFRNEIVPSLLNGPANGDVVPRCFLGEFHSPLSAWEVWWFGFTQKCQKRQSQNNGWSSCESCGNATTEGEEISGTTFKAGQTPCHISYLDFDKQRPQVVCAAEPNTVGQWLVKHAPLPGGETNSPACYRGAFRSHGDALVRRPRYEYQEAMHQLRMCSNPEASHFVERAALYLFASL